jgi:hypothetical protein
VFDPPGFGVGVDTSDIVQVSGSPVNAFHFVAVEGPPISPRVPEPSSLFLLFSALTGVAALAMKRHLWTAAHRK